MRVGFTGTRQGMSDWQRKQLIEWMEEHKPVEFHHGDCVGADMQAHDIALRARCWVVVHPSNDPTFRAFRKGHAVRPARPPLKRNRDIVNDTTCLIVAPQTDEEVLRSGTWATYRYARAIGRRVVMLSRQRATSCTLDKLVDV